ncbi:MAG: SusC/RagA family TonB-linked outer membrane protein [Mangrovibacterium sp.]
MRLTFVLVLLLTFHLSASVYSQQIKLSLNVTNLTIREVLNQIEEQSNFNFLIQDERLDLGQRISFNLDQRDIKEVLEHVFAGRDVRYVITEKNLIIITPGDGENNNRGEIGQSGKISGKVVDSNGQPLPGVTVVIKGTTNGMITDANGAFSLPNIPADATLQFSFVGMKTREIVVGNQTSVNVVLEEEIIGVDEVVVVGYGTMKKSDLTGSIGSINSDQLAKQGSKINILQAMQGMVPGLNIQHTASNASDDSYNVLIRGKNSIKASNTPLIILDGVPWDGGFNEIHQGDIQSIEVLKDASSAAIYGARGANGVILITTKRGKEGKASVKYEGNYGIQQIYNLPPVLTGEEWWDFAVERVGEKGVNYFPTVVANHNAGKSANWLDLATRTGQEQKHSVSVNGGNQGVLYYVSGTYSGIKGIAKGDDFKEAVVRTNLIVNITDWLSIATNSQYSYIDRSGVSADIGNAYLNNPLTNPFADDGTYSLRPWPEEATTANPLSNLYILDEDYAQRLFSNNYLEIKFPFIKGLSYKLNTGYTVNNSRVGRFYGQNTLIGFQNQGQSYTSDQWTNDALIENILTYQRSFGDHNIHFTGLYSIQKTKAEARSLTAMEFPTDILTWYQTNVAGSLMPGASYSKRSYISQMGRLTYGFQRKYLLTVTVRRDGYSGFGEETKFGIFPSAALGWNISNEEFMQEINWISNLKLRLSYGQNGNQAINPYATMANLQSMNYLGGDLANTTIAGYYPSSLATPTLTWETSATFNAGLDFSLMKSRISGSIDAYQTKSKDLLMDRSISSVHGITSIVQNIGKTRNTGIEVFLRSINIQKSDFSWNTEASVAYNKNKIVDLFGDRTTNDVNNKWFIGKPIDVNYAYVFDGVWQVGEDNSLQPTAKPGDIKVKDANKDGKIDADDRDFIGQRSPVYLLGLTNNLGYKNFMLSFSFYSPLGSTRVNPLWDTDIVYLDCRRNTIKLNWWREDNPNNEYPANRNTTNPYSVQFFQDASYLRLRDVTLSYRFPSQVLQHIGLRNLEIYGNIRNALTFTKWKGLDPELSGQRDVPLDRTYMIGLRVEL